MPKADFVTGLALAALGAFVAHESWNMPRFAERGAEPFSAPGLVPGLLGVLFVALGVILSVRAARQGGYRLGISGAAARRLFAEEPARRFLLALSLCLIYALGLIGHLPYALATGLFVTAFILLFERNQARSPRERGRLLLMAVAEGALVAAGVTLVFQELFLVALP